MTKTCPQCGKLIGNLNKINNGTVIFITTVSNGVIQYIKTSEQFENGHYFCPLCDVELFKNEQEVIDFFTN